MHRKAMNRICAHTFCPPLNPAREGRGWGLCLLQRAFAGQWPVLFPPTERGQPAH